MTTRLFRFMVLLSCLAGYPASGAERSLKVLLLYDMEGVSGATDYRHTSFDHKEAYTEARRSLTADVNAAIAGLKGAGATEIVVVDGHGSGNRDEPDVLADQILPPARMISRDAGFDIYMDSYDGSFDAIAAVAMHAGAGNHTGFLSHTYTGEDVAYEVNGVPFNESMILAMGAARLRIPLIMVSGDDQLEKEVLRFLPWVEYAAVKHAVDRAHAERFDPSDVSARIEGAARKALANLSQAHLPDFPGPYRFSLTFQDEPQARQAALIPGSELLSDGLSVEIRANDFEGGYRLSLRLIGQAGLVNDRSMMEAFLSAQPGRENLMQELTDVWYERFLGLGAPKTAEEPKVARKYFGAR